MHTSSIKLAKTRIVCPHHPCVTPKAKDQIKGTMRYQALALGQSFLNSSGSTHEAHEAIIFIRENTERQTQQQVGHLTHPGSTFHASCIRGYPLSPSVAEAHAHLVKVASDCVGGRWARERGNLELCKRVEICVRQSKRTGSTWDNLQNTCTHETFDHILVLVVWWQ
jgi:hypothetical protein